MLTLVLHRVQTEARRAWHWNVQLTAAVCLYARLAETTSPAQACWRCSVELNVEISTAFAHRNGWRDGNVVRRVIGESSVAICVVKNVFQRVCKSARAFL